MSWVRAGWPIGSPKSKHVLSTLAFTVLTLLGGLTATNLAPVVAQTDYYRATVALSPDPRDASTIMVPTIFGDVHLGYQGVAPGIVAIPQIRAEITDALAQPGMSASRLQPSDDEIADAVEAAAIAGTFSSAFSTARLSSSRTLSAPTPWRLVVPRLSSPS